jgi:hypothetical protein
MPLEDLEVTVGPKWEPAPPWHERPPRPPQPKLVTRWTDEKQARRALEDTLRPYGLVLVPEVRLLERGHPFQFIDYVALCPDVWPVKAVGIEVKRGFDKLKDGLDAVNQAKRYRKAVVSDARVSCVLGEPLEHIFIWPGLNWADDCSHKAGARAIRLDAGRANVGSIDAEYVWRYQNGDWRDARWMLRVRFTEGQEAFWTSQGFEMLDGYFGAASKKVGDPRRGLRSVE